MKFLALIHQRGYIARVAAKSAAGLGRPIRYGRIGASITIAGAIFSSPISFYGGCVWKGLGPAGFLYLRSTNPHTAATLLLGRKRGSSQSDTGAPPMHALIPSKIRAFAHRRMALSALRANSSLSVRLKRYNAHMEQARTLEAVGEIGRAHV